MRILATELRRLAWPVDEATYDKLRSISAGLRELAEEMAWIVGRYSEAEVPLWPQVAFFGPPAHMLPSCKGGSCQNSFP